MILRYKDLREDKDLEQKDIAAIIDVTREAYSKWELGIRDMPIKKCVELANFYETTIDYMVGLTNEKKYTKSNYQVDWNIIRNRLKELRKSKNLKQEEFSLQLGLKKRAYSNYENGTINPKTFKLTDIAKFYNISMDYLVGRKDTPKIE